MRYVLTSLVLLASIVGPTSSAHAESTTAHAETATPHAEPPLAHANAAPRLLAEPLGPDTIDARYGRTSAPRAPRPRHARFGGCSLIEPVCLHGTAGVDARVEAGGDRRGDVGLDSEIAARTLAAAERAYAGLRALGLPPPLLDGRLGPTSGVDVYLDPEAHGARAVDDPVTLGLGRDAASAFVIVRPRGRGASCALEHDVTRGLVQASLLGIDAATHDATLAAASSQLASLLAPCAPVELEAVDTWQRRPELAQSRAPAHDATGAVLWPEFLDATYGLGKPGLLLPSLVAIGSQRTPLDAPVWLDEPDDYDVLQRLLTARGTNLEDALLDFSIARAFVGSRSDEAHLTDVARYGDLGRVRIDWSVALASLPRRLRLRELEPTGAAYVWLSLDGATTADRLTVVAECEVSFAVRGALVTIDAEGRELGRHVAGRFGVSTMQMSLERLDQAKSVLVVVASLGRDDRARPFDPDDGEPREVACELTLHRQ